ncbi:MAG TPA: AGE family epimerase/isomerase [Methylocella sp.]|nr:AGE family epimerase/isomerase [Methylocella sp.]
MVSTSAVAELQNWLLQDALPLWADYGVDRKRGGFFERLNKDLTPFEEPRRARLVARQIYCFAMGQAVGFEGVGKGLVDHGLEFLNQRLIRPDGTLVQSVNIDLAVEKTEYDPYDYAFVLLALATAAHVFGDRDLLLAQAQKIRDRLIENWAHPRIGFSEPSVLKANPHMHLLEAFLAWAEVSGNGDPLWLELAGQMVELCCSYLILPQSGAVCEYFDADWQPKPDATGRLLIEPGHQFEWAWLLMRWAARTGDGEAFARAVRLVILAESRGIDPRRKIAINALDEEFNWRDGQAKLWPQTERIKAVHALASHPAALPADRDFARGKLTEAIAGLRLYLLQQPAGLWCEVMLEDGSFVDEPVRASSFYHIVCAIAVLSGTASFDRSVHDSFASGCEPIPKGEGIDRGEGPVPW